MKAETIVFLIDIQNGFAKNDLTPEQGGSLYVPGGENVGEPAARLIHNLSNSIIVLSQDFHPADHISFASNNPSAAPLSVVQLKKGADDKYLVAKEGEEGTLPQTMWLTHCIQGTESALFVDPVMSELPEGLKNKLFRHVSGETLSGADERGNSFYVIRKGMRSDLDSYGVETENDGISKTKASVVFEVIAERLNEKGVTSANVFVGGLATNFCVEFSHSDICKSFVPELNKRGIREDVYFLTDISAGIPIATSDGSWPDLDSATTRMAAFGTTEATTEDVIRAAMKDRAPEVTGAHYKKG
ncbi:MAG: hypothetical protein PHS57_01910 [Alphaproteobacteria bacterium]|nr:hypothetical protein [Alphaproteobacteria bacterium]